MDEEERSKVVVALKQFQSCYFELIRISATSGLQNLIGN
jgi:hypothetical protein